MPSPPECPHCHGAAWLYRDFGPQTNWKTQLVRCDVCSEARQQEHLRRLSGLSAEMLTWTLANFKRRPERAQAVQAALAAIREPRYWLTFTGEPGTGKTYLLASIVNALRQAGHTAVYTTMADLLDHFRQAYRPGAGEPDYDDLWEKVVGAKCLAIDEIEKFRPTPWAEEKVFQLLDERYRQASRQLTVFASNRKIAHGVQLLDDTRYPGYLESRLLDGRNVVVALRGGDVRPALTRPLASAAGDGAP